MRVILAAAALTVCGLVPAHAEEVRRYQLATNPIVVLDAESGALWKAESDGKGGYIMVPMPYRASDGKSVTLTPPKPN
jgi:hypothetical protein